MLPHHRSHPAPRHPCHHSTDRNVVVKKSSVAIIYLTLTRSNYTKWALVMQVNLQAAGLWDAIELDTDNYYEDQSALAVLLHAVPKEMQPGLARKESTTDAWEAIRVIRMGGDHIKEATTDKLHRDFGDMQSKAEECVEDFSLCVSALANQLRALDNKISNKGVIKKILHSVPDHLEQVAISIKTLLDLKSMPIEEATGHLRAMEERKKKVTGGAKEGRMLLTEEEWMARLKAHEGKLSNSNHGGRGRGRGREQRGGGGGHGSSDGGGSQSDSHEEGVHRSKAHGTCRAYGKLGHWAKECRSKGVKKATQANVEEEEGGLMLAKAIQIGKFSSTSISALAVATCSWP
jgi:uncharacterized membrane protein YgcG